MEGPAAEAYASASGYLVDLVGSVPSERWETPALGSWSVRELVGHANRAHLLLEEYLLDPKPTEPKGSPYFSEGAIAERGRAAVALLGDDPAWTVSACAARALRLVRAAEATAPLQGPQGATTLGSYLPSRTAELAIHGLDLARALGLPPGLPADALAEGLAFCVGKAAERGWGADLLLALSGRSLLDGGFSVY